MKTLAILNNHGVTPLKKIEVEVEVKEYDKSITDPTFYTPIGSLVRKLNSQDKIAMSRDPNLYDFPDGKDTGIELPLSRQKGVDIAELSQENIELTNSVKKALNEEAKRRKAEKHEKASGDGAKTTSNNGGVPTTDVQA